MLNLTSKALARWAPSSKFVSSSIPSWQTLAAHAQQFRRARDLVLCLTVPLDSLLVWASSEGSGETARMRRLAWTFAARIGDKYQIRLTRSRWYKNFNGIRMKNYFKQKYFNFISLDYYKTKIWELRHPCLFVLRLNVPVNNFSVMSGWSHRFLGN